VVAHADDLDPAGEVWPRPRLVDGLRVFTFDDSSVAYDQRQVRDDLHDGDVLHIPAERVAGFLMHAWPLHDLLGIPEDFIPIGIALLGHTAADAAQFGDVSG
jgi:hypothetical protein